MLCKISILIGIFCNLSLPKQCKSIDFALFLNKIQIDFPPAILTQYLYHLIPTPEKAFV